MPISRVSAAPSASGARADIRYTPDRPGLTHRLVLVLYALLAVAALVALLRHDPGDPAWSTSGTHEDIRNPLGVWGAWGADIGLTLLGYSVGWLLVLAFRQCLSMTADLIRPHDMPVPAHEVSPGRRALGQLRFWGGVVLLLCSSCALEWTRLAYTPGNLPDHAGGVLGYALGRWSTGLMGPDWAGVMWVCVLVLSVSWALSFSWLRLADGLGSWLDVRRDEKVHREAAALDERLGAAALREREQADRPEPALGLSHSLARDAELLQQDRARLEAAHLRPAEPVAPPPIAE